MKVIQFIVIFILLVAISSWAKDDFKVIYTKGIVTVNKASTKKDESPKIGSTIDEKDKIITGEKAIIKFVSNKGNTISVGEKTEMIVGPQKDTSQEQVSMFDLVQGKMRAKTSELVKYSGGETNKFEIKTKAAVAGIRGSEALVNHDAAKNATQVFNISGKIYIAKPKENGERIVINIPEAQFSAASHNTQPTPPAPIPPAMKSEMLKGTETPQNNESSKTESKTETQTQTQTTSEPVAAPPLLDGANADTTQISQAVADSNLKVGTESLVTLSTEVFSPVEDATTAPITTTPTPFIEKNKLNITVRIKQ